MSTKLQISPTVAAACIVVILGILAYVGYRVFGPPPTPSAGKNESPTQEKVINGIKIPAGVPSDYANEPPRQGGR